MEDSEVTSAKAREGNFGDYQCACCQPPETFPSFLTMIDHSVQTLYMRTHKPPRPPLGVEDSIWRYQEALRRNPGKAPHAVQPLPPYVLAPLQWAELSSRRQKILPEQKVFLPAISVWLEKALSSLSDLGSIQESSMIVADQLVDLVKLLATVFHEQREYFLEHVERLKDTGMDPKWPRRPGTQARFVARSMAGARWQIPPSTSREYIRLEWRKGRIPRLVQPGAGTFSLEGESSNEKGGP